MARKREVGARARRERRDTLRARVVKSAAKTHVGKARRLIAAGALSDAEQALKDAVRALDKAAEKHIIHKNNAARRKSRLMRLFNAARG